MLKKVKKVGQGSYGIVYTAQKEEDTFAVKRNIVEKTSDFIGSIRELDILVKLSNHPYIVKLNSVSFGTPFSDKSFSPIKSPSQKNDKIHFIFESATEDLNDRIYRKKDSFLQKKYFALQMLLAVEYIHSKKIIHRDIKPGNFLVFQGKNSIDIKLCDFGMSKPYTIQGCQTPRTVTSWYRAPEIVFEDSNYTYKVDEWSVGCVIFELFTKSALLYGCDDKAESIASCMVSRVKDIFTEEVMTKLSDRFNKKIIWKRSSKSFCFEDYFPKEVKAKKEYNDLISLLKSLLDPFPENRITATEALNHPFFSDCIDLIESCQKSFPLVKEPSPILNPIKCIQRDWMAETVIEIFNNNEEYEWYSHRILFQAISIFDRYLNYEYDKNGGINLNQQETLLRFMTCLYVSVKYFFTLTCVVRFEEIISDKYRKRTLIKEAEKFEEDLVKNILKYEIYKDTVYEIADRYNHVLSEKEVKGLLETVLFTYDCKGFSTRQLYDAYIESLEE